MRRLCLLVAMMVLALGQDKSSSDVRLPNGKLQRDEIIRADHKKNVEDAASLVRLAQEVKDDLDRLDSYVVSVKTLKELDDLEKLDKGIRSRLKRY